MRHKVITVKRPNGFCACGVPRHHAPEWHYRQVVCECIHHDREHCPACVLEIMLVEQAEIYLAAIAESGDE